MFKLILRRFKPEEVKEYSDEIILRDMNVRQKARYMGLNKIQLYDWDILNDRVLYSLKEAEGFLGLQISETEVDFNLDRPLTDEERALTEKYNRADLNATWEEVLEQVPHIKIRCALMKEYNMPKEVISKTNQYITGEILGGEYRSYKDQKQPYDPSIAPVEINKPVYRQALEMFTNCEELDYKKKLKIDICGVEHIIAIGGLHGARKNFWYQGEIWDIDVGSYYPNMMLNFNLVSRALKDPNRFKEIVDKRLAIKKKVNQAFADGKENELTLVERNMPYGLKLVVNTVSGAMKAKFSKIYDERNNNWMCITGQLLLIDLLEKLEPYITLIQWT